MAVAIREQLLSAITTALGAEFGLPVPEDDRDLPLIVVQDGVDEAEDSAYNQTKVLMPVSVASIDLTSSSDRDVMRAEANALVASIITTMYADETFGALAERVSYTGCEIEAEAGKYVFARAEFVVEFHFQRGNPFVID